MCFVLAAVVAVRGRVDFYLGHHRIAIRGVALPGVIAWALLLAWVRGISRDRLRQLIDAGQRRVRAHAAAIAMSITAATLLVGIGKGAFVAAGADPYGYVSQAQLWTAGNPIQPVPQFVMDAPWRDVEWAFSPLGYRPGVSRGTIVPTYSIGLPLQMAGLSRIAGARAVFLTVPLLGALSVWIAFAIARRAASPEIAVLAALFAACNPVFLFQLVQPMSDVPVTAWWLAAVAFGFGGTLTSALAGGAAASLAILTRPNTAMVLLAVVYHVAASANSWRTRAASASMFLAGAVPGIAVTAWSNAVLYGAPYASGYGPLGDIFGGRGAAAMTLQYLRSLSGVYTPLVFAAFVACGAALARPSAMRPETRRLCVTACAFFVLLLAGYAQYSVFDLRFLLPAVALLIVASTAAIAAWCAEWPAGVRGIAYAMAATLLPLAFVHRATHDNAWRLKAAFGERYIGSAARARSLPHDAVLLSILESGSLRYYSGRVTLRFDWIPSRWMGRWCTSGGSAATCTLWAAQRS
jgi:hypothetical protein